MKKTLYSLTVENPEVADAIFNVDKSEETPEDFQLEDVNEMETITTECFKYIDAITILKDQQRKNNEAIKASVCTVNNLHRSNETFSYVGGMLNLSKNQLAKYKVSTEGHNGIREQLTISNEFISDFITTIINAIKKAWDAITFWFKKTWVKFLAWITKLGSYFSNALTDIYQIQCPDALALNKNTIGIIDKVNTMQFDAIGSNGGIIDIDFTKSVSASDIANVLNAYLYFIKRFCRLPITGDVNLDDIKTNTVIKNDFTNLKTYNITLNGDEEIINIIYLSPDKLKAIIWNNSNKVADIKEFERIEQKWGEGVNEADITNYNKNDFVQVATECTDLHKLIDKEISDWFAKTDDARKAILKELSSNKQTTDDDIKKYQIFTKRASAEIIQNAYTILDNLKYLNKIFKLMKHDFTQSSDLYFDKVYNNLKTNKKAQDEINNSFEKQMKFKLDFSTLKLEKLKNGCFFKIKFETSFARRFNAFALTGEPTITILDSDSGDVLAKNIKSNDDAIKNAKWCIFVSDIFVKHFANFVYFHELGHILMNDYTDNKMYNVSLKNMYPEATNEEECIKNVIDILTSDGNKYGEQVMEGNIKLDLGTLFLYSFNSIELRADAYAILNTSMLSGFKLLTRKSKFNNPGAWIFPNLYDTLLQNEINYVKKFTNATLIEQFKCLLFPKRRKEYIPKGPDGLHPLCSKHKVILDEIADALTKDYSIITSGGSIFNNPRAALERLMHNLNEIKRCYKENKDGSDIKKVDEPNFKVMK